jgi:hypothetical protein
VNAATADIDHLAASGKIMDNTLARPEFEGGTGSDGYR